MNRRGRESRILTKIQTWECSWKCGKPHSIGPPFPEDRLGWAVWLRYNKDFLRGHILHDCYHLCMDVVCCENHLTCSGFILEQRNISVPLSLFHQLSFSVEMKARLRGPAIHPDLHYTLQKYICNSLNLPHFGSLHTENSSLKSFASFSTWKTPSSKSVNGILKNQEVRMERWEGKRSRGTIFLTWRSFQGFLFLQMMGNNKELQACFRERAERSSCHRICERLILYIYV